MTTKNNAILKYGIILVIICFVFSSIFYSVLEIDEAVFLEHYYEISAYNGTNFILYYITSKNDDRRIVDINFADNKFNEVITINDLSENEIEVFPHYKYKELIVSFQNIKETDELDTIELKDATLVFNSGDKQKVNLGRIILNSNMNRSGLFEMSYSSSSSDNKSSDEVIALREGQIIDIDSDFEDETKGILFFKVNGILQESLIFPLKFSKDERIKYDSQIIMEENDMRKYNAYDVRKRVHILDEDGKVGYNIHNANYKPGDVFIKESGIIKFLKFKGVL